MTTGFGGLASGIDTGSIISGLMKVAQAPMDQLSTLKNQVDSASTSISTFSSKLSALKNAALALSTSTGFASFAASSSDTAVVASVTGSASVASYSVSVNLLAQAQKTKSSVFGASSTALNQAGTLSLKVGAGAAVDITIAASDTLTDLANKISASGQRVTASVMNTGTGYRLLVQGMDSGAANSFTLTEGAGVTLGFALAGATYQPAQDADLTVDNMPITSKTNQITGVIPGVTLAVTKVTTSAATVNVTSDPTALEKKINSLVTAYNDFVNNGHTAAGYGPTKATNPVLAADSSIRRSLDTVRRATGTVVANASKYQTLASIGLTFSTSDGTMKFDATTFEAALAADPTSVRRLFVSDSAAGTTSVMAKLMTSVDSLVKGASTPVQARIDSLSKQSQRLSVQQSKMQDQLDAYQAQLTKQFTVMDGLVGKYNSMQTAVANIANVPVAGK